MKKYILLLFLVSGSAFSQNINGLKKSALKDAKALSEASMEKDVNTIVKYTHPKIAKKYNEKQLREGIEEVYRTMSAQKIKIISSKVDKLADIRKEGKEYRCLVTNTIKMDFNGRKVTLKSSLFGFYNKKEDQWHFIESDKLLNDPETKDIFSDFKTEIDIPQDEHISEN
ncbi:hypothetical protein GCM10022393_06130 [Aquimarina addita]|uniref:Nuclear transport factor 2 family protein n=1 Tax=Aquimarina addita TaxID=870485 RepID=A0ABP7XBU4_9FLAO